MTGTPQTYVTSICDEEPHAAVLTDVGPQPLIALVEDAPLEVAQAAVAELVTADTEAEVRTRPRRPRRSARTGLT